MQDSIRNLNLVACFTGYRSQKLPWGFNENDERCLKMIERFKSEIVKAIEEGYYHFISGMAIGFDMIAAEIVLELREKYSYLILECALPCKGQGKKWSIELQERYHKILKKADKIWCGREQYVEGCMMERNIYMINNSFKVIALFDGKPGGTMKTLEYAKEKGREIVIIEP